MRRVILIILLAYFGNLQPALAKKAHQDIGVALAKIDYYLNEYNSATTAENKKRALKLLWGWRLKAAKEGSAENQEEYGRFCNEGYSYIEPCTEREQIQWLERAAQNGAIYAYRILGRILYEPHWDIETVRNRPYYLEQYYHANPDIENAERVYWAYDGLGDYPLPTAEKISNYLSAKTWALVAERKPTHLDLKINACLGDGFKLFGVYLGCISRDELNQIISGYSEGEVFKPDGFESFPAIYGFESSDFLPETSYLYVLYNDDRINGIPKNLTYLLKNGKKPTVKKVKEKLDSKYGKALVMYDFYGLTGWSFHYIWGDDKTYKIHLIKDATLWGTFLEIQVSPYDNNWPNPGTLFYGIRKSMGKVADAL